MSKTEQGGLQAEAAPAFEANFKPSWVPVTVLHLAVCLAVVVLTTIAVRLYVYNYMHAWVSAHFAVMARTFNTVGLFDLGFVPVQNNMPLTTSPDAYLHWPPLYPVLLALLFRVFGEGVIVQHLSSVALNVASAALIWRSFAGQSDKIAAGAAALSFLSAPAMFHYGFVGLHLHLAILLTVLSLFLFANGTGAAARDTDAPHRRIVLGLGAFAYFCAVMTSWEPLLAAPAFCIFALRDRHRQTTLALILFGLAAVIALLSIVLLYSTEYPYFTERLWNRALMRSGMSTPIYPPGYTPHDLQDIIFTNPTFPWGRYLWAGILWRLPDLGALGAVGLLGGLACMRTAAAFPRPVVAIYLGSLSMFCLWSIFMRNHMGIHHYEMLIALPAAACGAGLCVMRFIAHQGTGSARRIALVCFLAPILAASSSYKTVRDVLEDFTSSSAMITLAKLSRETLPENAIVVTPYFDMVFVYYSNRHVIRAIENEASLDREQRGISALCPDCPNYLVAESAAVADFPSYGQKKPLAEIPDTGAIWRLGDLSSTGQAATATPPALP